MGTFDLRWCNREENVTTATQAAVVVAQKIAGFSSTQPR